jgi:DNA-binding NarL/FixJ family response regulator
VNVDELVKAIRSVNAGESMLHPAIARKVINHFSQSEQKQSTGDLLEQLTEREVEVLHLAAKGMSNRDISRALSISIRTVQTHLSNIFNKLGVGSRTEAVVLGLRKGLFSLEETC